MEATWTQNGTFDGSGDWSDASQWSPGPPGPGDTAFIPAGTVTHGQDNNDVIGELFDYVPFKMAAGTLTVAGTAYLAASPPDTPVSPHLVQIGGSLVLGGGSTVYGIYQTGGLLEIANGGTVVGGATIQGTLEIDTGALTINQDQTDLSTLVTDGQLGGTITGNGTLVISNAVNRTLEPGLVLGIATPMATGVDVVSTNKGAVIAGANLSYSGALVSTARGTIGLGGHTLTALGSVALQGVLLGAGVLMIQNTGTLGGFIGGGATAVVDGTVTAASSLGDLTLDAAASVLRVATAAGTLDLMGNIGTGLSAAGTLALAGGTLDAQTNAAVQVPVIGTGEILVDFGKTLFLNGAVALTGLIDGLGGALVLGGGTAAVTPSTGNSVAIRVESTALQSETMVIGSPVTYLTDFSMDNASTLFIGAAATLDNSAQTLDGLVTGLIGAIATQTLTLPLGLRTQGLMVDGHVELLVGGNPSAHSTVSGTLDFGPQGSTAGGMFVNAAGSTLTLTEGSKIHAVSSGDFNNQGVINMVGATIAAHGTSSGTIVVSAGTDTDISTLVGSILNTGTVEVDSGVLQSLSAYNSSGNARLVGDGTVEFEFGGNSITGTQGYTMPMTVIDNTGFVQLNTPNLQLQGLLEGTLSQIELHQSASIVTAAALSGTITDADFNASLFLLGGGNLFAPLVLGGDVGLRNEATLTIAKALQIGNGSGNLPALINDDTLLLQDGATITAQASSADIVNGPTALLAAMTSGTLDIPAAVVNFGSIAVRSGTLKLDQRVTTPGTINSSIEVLGEAVLELGKFAGSGTFATIDAAGILRLDSLPAITDGTVEAHIGAGVVITNFLATGSNYLFGVMSLSDGVHTPALHLVALDSGEKFTVSTDGFGDTVISAIHAPACFAAGTRILIGAGEVAVEDLRGGRSWWWLIAATCGWRFGRWCGLDVVGSIAVVIRGRNWCGRCGLRPAHSGRSDRGAIYGCRPIMLYLQGMF